MKIAGVGTLLSRPDDGYGRRGTTLSLENPKSGMPPGIPLPPLNAKVDGEGLPRPPAWEPHVADSAAQMRDEIRQLTTDLRHSLDSLPDRLDTIVYQSVSPSLQSLSLLVSGLEGRFEGLENAVVQLEAQSGGAMEVHLGALGMRLDGLMKSQEQTGRQLHDLFEGATLQANEETDRLIDTLNARFNGLLTLLNRVEERVSALEYNIGQLSLAQNHSAATQAQALDDRLSRLESLLMHGLGSSQGGDREDRSRPWWRWRGSEPVSATTEYEESPPAIEVWDENTRRVRTTTPDVMPRPPRGGPR